MAKSKKKKRKNAYWIRAIAAIAFIAGCVLFVKSSFFSVRNIIVNGNVNLAEGDIVSISAVRRGDNIFSLKKSIIRENIFRSPYIKEVKITRSLPDTVIIDVVERTEFATAFCNGRYIVLDSEGMVLRVSDKEEYYSFIDDLTFVKTETGEFVVVEEDEWLKTALFLIELANEEDFYFERLSLDGETVRAYIYYDRYCCEGRAENIAKSMGQIKKLVASQYIADISRGTIHVEAGGYLSFEP